MPDGSTASRMITVSGDVSAADADLDASADITVTGSLTATAADLNAGGNIEGAGTVDLDTANLAAGGDITLTNVLNDYEKRYGKLEVIPQRPGDATVQ